VRWAYGYEGYARKALQRPKWKGPMESLE